jgi:hypothetical protein
MEHFLSFFYWNWMKASWSMESFSHERGPAHSHALQAYPRLDFEFLATLAAVVLNRQERHPRWLR